MPLTIALASRAITSRCALPSFSPIDPGLLLSVFECLIVAPVRYGFAVQLRTQSGRAEKLQQKRDAPAGAKKAAAGASASAGIGGAGSSSSSASVAVQWIERLRLRSTSLMSFRAVARARVVSKGTSPQNSRTSLRTNWSWCSSV